MGPLFKIYTKRLILRKTDPWGLYEEAILYWSSDRTHVNTPHPDTNQSTVTFFSNTHRERLSHPEGERFRRASLCLRPSLEESPGCCAWWVLAGCSVDSAPWVKHKCQSTGPDATVRNQKSCLATRGAYPDPRPSTWQIKYNIMRRKSVFVHCNDFQHRDTGAEECSSVVELSPCLHEALGSSPSKNTSLYRYRNIISTHTH